jgi:hypothetical protein
MQRDTDAVEADRHRLILTVFRLVSFPIMAEMLMTTGVPTSSVGMFIFAHVTLATCIEVKMPGLETFNLAMFQSMVGMLAGLGLITMAMHFGQMTGMRGAFF